VRLDPQETIAQIPILKIRDFIRSHADYSWSMSSLASALKLSPKRASEVLQELLHRGYIRLDRPKHNGDHYRRTQDGATFCLASGSRPITRRVADRKLAEFLQRVHQVNASPNFAYRVRKVEVFGSYLTNSETLSDVDIAVDLAPREADSKKQDALHEDRIKHALSQKRSFRNIVDEEYWPEREVLLFLKSHSHAISLHTISDKRVYGDKCKVLYEEPNTINAVQQSPYL
jgi:predicted nucleotidyltransferase